MSLLTSSIDGLEAASYTPDEQVFAAVHGRTTITVSFAPGYYHRADEATLEWQFARLGKLLFGETVTRESPPEGVRDEEYVRRRAELVATGTSSDGRIVVSVVGMREWAITITPGTCSALSEDAFCRAMGEAATAMMTDQFGQIRALKHEVYAGT
jgi:hypothetical protein